MDSKAINSLIRSEVWPLLRKQSFTTFEARTAFRHRDPFIDVVNFQSFNKNLAERLGCTTFSFALNLGVYVIGSSREDRLKRDRRGELLPREYECSFRTQPEKRSPRDGFQRSDIFSIDGAGKSVAVCFDEARYLLSEAAPVWFDSHSDLSRLISRVENSSNGSLTSNDLLATLRRADYRRFATSETGHMLFQQVEALIGSYFDLPQTLITVIRTEREVFRVRDLIAGSGGENLLPLSITLPTRIFLFGSA
jgi:hypothetical protein